MTQDKISLTLTPREITGKQVKQLRRDGLVPAVIHDHGKDSVNVQAEYNELAKVFRQAGKHHPVNLKAGDKTYLAIIKSATFEPRKNRLNHIVFNAVSANEKVEAEIPVRAKYDEGNEVSPAERNSLIVLSNLESVLVEAVPSKLPDYLEYDGEKLVEVGDHVTVGDLIIPEGVEIKVEPGNSVATVYEPSAIAAANDDAGGDEEASVEDVESEQGEGEATDESAGEKSEDSKE
ncbi:50S ribosomal protein L25 [Candidatus Saccharibacteria bacterium]|nr:50S ribosomal protein L25 [Candidatus Saccharibacteria bacterium]